MRHFSTITIGVALASLISVGCGDEVLLGTPVMSTSGTGGQPTTSGSGGAGAGVAEGGAGSGRWDTDDPDLQEILNHAEELDGTEDLICVGIYGQNRTLRGVALRRFGNDQGPFETFEISALSSDVPFVNGSFDIRDGYMYGCNAEGMWRVRLDGESDLETQVGPPCRSFAFANQGIWILLFKPPSFTLQFYASWADLSSDTPSGAPITLTHEIHSIDSEDGTSVWMQTTDPPFAVYDLAEGTTPLREYDYFPVGTLSSVFDAVADNQTFYTTVLDYDRPGLLGFSHQSGSIQLTAQTDVLLHTLHCWTR